MGLAYPDHLDFQAERAGPCHQGQRPVHRVPDSFWVAEHHPLRGVSGMLYHTPCAQRVLKGRYHAKQQRSSIRLTTVTVDDAHALEHKTARFDPVAPGRSFHHAPPRKGW